MIKKIFFYTYFYIFVTIFSLETLYAILIELVQGSSRAQAEIVLIYYVPFQIISIPYLGLYIYKVFIKKEVSHLNKVVFIHIFNILFPWIGLALDLAIMSI